MAGPSYVLLYDRDCGICSALSRWIRAVDIRRRIRLQSIQSGRALLRGIPEDRMLDAWHMVAPNGLVTTGGDAVPTLVGAFPIGAGFGRLLRGSSGLMRQVHRFYAFLTRFRDRLVCRLDAAPPSADSARRRGTAASSGSSDSRHRPRGTRSSPGAPGSAPRVRRNRTLPFRACPSRAPG